MKQCGLIFMDLPVRKSSSPRWTWNWVHCGLLNAISVIYSDPICILCSARDHARETLRSQAAPENLVSHQSAALAW